jgi:hypothetical protein
MTNTYISHFDYMRATTGQETASLVGNSGRLTGNAAGATSLGVTPHLTIEQIQYDQVYIFDGSNSEIVTVGSAGAAIGASSIPVSACQFAHAAGTAYCTDGTLGSLAAEIITASDMVEDTCLQSLLLSTRIDTLSLQTTRAAVGKDHVLVTRPMNFPVQTVTSLVLNVPGSAQVTFDATQAFLDGGQQLVKFFQLIPTGSVPFGSPFQTMLNQRTVGTVVLTYTSGFAYASMSPRIKKACVLYVSDLLSKRRNSVGASEYTSGHVKMKWGHIGDTSGESDLIKQARGLLSSFIQEAF